MTQESGDQFDRYEHFKKHGGLGDTSVLTELWEKLEEYQGAFEGLINEYYLQVFDREQPLDPRKLSPILLLEGEQIPGTVCRDFPREENTDRVVPDDLDDFSKFFNFPIYSVAELSKLGSASEKSPLLPFLREEFFSNLEMVEKKGLPKGYHFLILDAARPLDVQYTLYRNSINQIIWDDFKPSYLEFLMGKECDDLIINEDQNIAEEDVFLMTHWPTEFGQALKKLREDGYEGLVAQFDEYIKGESTHEVNERMKILLTIAKPKDLLGKDLTVAEPSLSGYVTPHEAFDAVDITLIRLSQEGEEALEDLNKLKEAKKLGETYSDLKTFLLKEDVKGWIENEEKVRKEEESDWEGLFFQEKCIEESIFYVKKMEILKRYASVLDMGTKPDDTSDKAATMYYENILARNTEGQHIVNSNREGDERYISEQDYKILLNRRLLFWSMAIIGAMNYYREWWHYGYRITMSAVMKDSLAPTLHSRGILSKRQRRLDFLRKILNESIEKIGYKIDFQTDLFPDDQ